MTEERHDLRARVQSVDYGRCFNMHLMGEGYVAKDVEYRPIEQGDMLPNPTAILSHRAARQLMDDLWREGVRPTHITNQEVATPFLQDHLEDMRAIAFNKLKMEAPK